LTDRIALVVDDNATNRLLARTLLKKLGWQSEEADCGAAAIALLQGRRFSFILLDISMPGMSGEETCAVIRGMREGSEIPIIAYTAHAFPEEKARILAAGFDDLVIKPISLQSLEDAIPKPS
jgi:CheY-like chemotaxis protein